VSLFQTNRALASEAVAGPEEAQESAPAWIKGVLRPAQQTADPAALFR